MNTPATDSAAPPLPPLSALLRVPDVPQSAAPASRPHRERDVTAAAQAALARHAAHAKDAASTYIPARRIDKIHPETTTREPGHGQRKLAVALIAAGTLLAAVGGVAQYASRAPAHPRQAFARAASARRVATVARAAPPADRSRRAARVIPAPAPAAASVIAYHGPYTSPLAAPAWLTAAGPPRWYPAPTENAAPRLRHPAVPAWHPHAAPAPAPDRIAASAPVIAPQPQASVSPPAVRSARPFPPAAPRAPALRAPTPASAPASRLTVVSVPSVQPVAEAAAPAPAHAAPVPVAAKATAAPGTYRVVTFVSPRMVLIESASNGRKWVSAYTVGQKLPNGRVITSIDPATHRISTR